MERGSAWGVVRPYLPALGSVVMVLLAALAAALTDGQIYISEVVALVVAGLGAVLTYVVPNVQGVTWLKPAVTAAAAAFNALQGYLTDGLTSQEITLVLIAGLGSVVAVSATNKYAPVHVPDRGGPAAVS